MARQKIKKAAYLGGLINRRNNLRIYGVKRTLFYLTIFLLEDFWTSPFFLNLRLEPSLEREERRRILL